MPTARRPLVFAMALATGLLSPERCPAAVAPSMPESIVVARMDEHDDLIFVVYADGQFDKGVLLDPRTAERHSSQVRLPRGLPMGRLTLLGVPRALAEQSKNAPDPAWLKDAVPGVVRVTGVIHHYPVERSSALHRYHLEKTDAGLELTLLNPDVLTPYPAENLRPEKPAATDYLWIVFAGVVVVLSAGVLAVWGFNPRKSAGGSRS